MTKQYTITLSDAQDKALATIAYDVQVFLENFAHVRADQALEEIFIAEVQRKVSAGETISGSKDEIVLAANVKSAKQNTDELEAQARLETEQQG